MERLFDANYRENVDRVQLHFQLMIIKNALFVYKQQFFFSVPSRTTHVYDVYDVTLYLRFVKV